MAFLFGQPITQNTSSQEKIKKLENGVDVQVNVEEVFGIKNPNPKGEKIYSIGLYFLTTEPLPTAASPAKSEPKKRGRKPKETATAWSWRIKTDKELIEDYGKDYRSEQWYGGGKEYLLGQPIIQKPESEDFIQEYAIQNQKVYERPDVKSINTFDILGITSGDDDYWIVSYEFLTDKPLPTAAAPTKSEPKKRGRTQQNTNTKKNKQINGFIFRKTKSSSTIFNKRREYLKSSGGCKKN